MEFQIEYRTQTTVQLDLEKSLKIFEQNQKSNRRYLKIMRIFQDPSQPLDREFQKLFNGFYRVRRGSDWQEACYHIMEMHRTDPSVTFPQLLNELTYHTGKVDFSFATKILHTINPRMPIYDSIIATNLALWNNYDGSVDRKMCRAIVIYDQLQQAYRQLQTMPEMLQCVDAFNRRFLDFLNISTLKKIDFLLWSNREETENE